MKRQTGTRLVLALLVLTLALTLSAVAERAEASHCTKSCELNCLPRLEACLEGLLYPECGGSSTCCSNATQACFNCCTWY